MLDVAEAPNGLFWPRPHRAADKLACVVEIGIVALVPPLPTQTKLSASQVFAVTRGPDDLLHGGDEVGVLEDAKTQFFRQGDESGMFRSRC